jgi:hypothetical protein
VNKSATETATLSCIGRLKGFPASENLRDTQHTHSKSNVGTIWPKQDSYGLASTLQ